MSLQCFERLDAALMKTTAKHFYISFLCIESSQHMHWYDQWRWLTFGTKNLRSTLRNPASTSREEITWNPEDEKRTEEMK